MMERTGEERPLDVKLNAGKTTCRVKQTNDLERLSCTALVLSGF